MPKIAPWHSAREAVHHDNSECVRGAAVARVDRLEGDGGKPLCPICVRLDDAEANVGAG